VLESAGLQTRNRLLASIGTALDPASDPPEALAARIQAGDRRAEERVVEIYGRGVAVLLDRHTNGRPEAEDLFQDTFRLVLEKLRRGELREPAKLPAFLAQVARSLAIEHYRKATRRKTEADSEAVELAVAPVAGPLSGLLESENASLVRRVIRELGNERDREILLRFYIAEEDKDRIAADHGLTSLQFNRVLHRARQRYKELFLERTGGKGFSAVEGAIILCLITLWRGMLRGAGG
jgi:RNA polymerase sigma-70 factor, ECF subfamily